jgi:hypothetical protein
VAKGFIDKRDKELRISGGKDPHISLSVIAGRKQSPTNWTPTSVYIIKKEEEIIRRVVVLI